MITGWGLEAAGAASAFGWRPSTPVTARAILESGVTDRELRRRIGVELAAKVPDALLSGSVPIRRIRPDTPLDRPARPALMLPIPTDRLPRPLATELTRRSLWGALPRAVRPAPAGPPLLALSFDNDYQADSDATLALLDLIGEFDARLTVFAIGRLVEASPAPYREIVRRGHEIGNHTWSHPDNPVLNPEREFWHLDVDEMREEIGRCQDVVEAVSGVRPTSFRSPHFKDAFRMMEALAHFPEITCVSTALASKCPVPTPYLPAREPLAGDLSLHFPARAAKGPEAVSGGNPLMVPLTPCPGMRWSPFCSYSAIRRPANPAQGAGMLDVAEWERRWGVMLARAERRRFASVYFDALDVMRDAETRSAFRRMLGHAIGSGWCVATVAEIERAWRPVAPV